MSKARSRGERQERRVGGHDRSRIRHRLVRARREAAREALDSVFDTLIVCGFAFEPKVNEEALTRFPRLTVLKARMNNDLHLADSLKSDQQRQPLRDLRRAGHHDPPRRGWPSRG